MMNHKSTIFVDYTKWLKRLDTQLNKTTNQYSTEVPKVGKPTKKTRYYKTLGTNVIH